MRRAIWFGVAMLAVVAMATLPPAWLLRKAQAARGKPVVASPEESMRWIQRCAIAMLTVDGVPVYRHAWCLWDDERKVFEPMEKDLDRRGIINITPEED